MRRNLRVAAWTVVAGTAAGLLMWWLLALASVDARPAYCVTVGLAVVSLGVLGRQMTEPAGAFTPAELAEPYERRGLTELIILEQQLAWGSLDADRFESRIRPLLARLVDERLRQRHGLDFARDGARARPILGEDLWHLMTDQRPIPKPLSRREMSSLVEQIERI